MNLKMHKTRVFAWSSLPVTLLAVWLIRTFGRSLITVSVLSLLVITVLLIDFKWDLEAESIRPEEE